jgi:hypothetical protein
MVEVSFEDMLRADQIRRWRRVGLCGLLCLVVSVIASAQTETSAQPKSPAQTSTTQTAKAKTPTSTHASPKQPSTHASSSSQKSKSARGKNGSTQVAKKRVAKKRGQQAIDPGRAREIQTALIREHYMQGSPTGTWDATTQAAMQRYQADQGWQSKTTPDSRALIKLGLGPSHDHLLNPENAMTSAPATVDPKAAAKQTPGVNNIPQQ